ncbi:MAG: FkbM family methyltransferase [Chloroflexota bacterium]|nr:FkbM family methyltransferase [Chloroflexota bacterium]
MIGPYGPFKLDRRFAFSNFSKWGSGHNRGFVSCIDLANGKHTVFDIGAHIGLVTLPLAATISARGTIYAFEPGNSNRKFLEQHLRINEIKNVTVVSDLVGEKFKASANFYQSTSDSGMNTITDTGRRKGYKQTIVKQITLDEFCNLHKLQPQLIKIDVEGAELRVLQGGVKVLRQYMPTIFLSVHPRHIAESGGSTKELEQFIAKMGYQVFDFDGNTVKPCELTEYIVSPAFDQATSTRKGR